MPKGGRSGPLVFVTVRHEIAQAGSTRVLEYQTIVYRQAATGAGPTPPAPAGAQFSRTWRPDSTTLFRYSALTFNGHRIHYDVDYARDVEGYPGLVVHGPLLVTLMLDLAVAHGRPLTAFTYRARSPLFAPHGFRVNGRGDADTTDLWVSGDHGGLAMEGRAE